MSQLSKSATFHDFGEEPCLEQPGSPGENRDLHTPLASEKRGRANTLSNWLGMFVSKRRSAMRPSMSMSLGMSLFCAFMMFLFLFMFFFKLVST